jgi:hypothetical protein
VDPSRDYCRRLYDFKSTYDRYLGGNLSSLAYAPTDTAKHEIRVLLLWLRTAVNIIEYTISVSGLDSQSTYEALSYEWGLSDADVRLILTSVARRRRNLSCGSTWRLLSSSIGTSRAAARTFRPANTCCFLETTALDQSYALLSVTKCNLNISRSCPRIQTTSRSLVLTSFPCLDFLSIRKHRDKS